MTPVLQQDFELSCPSQHPKFEMAFSWKPHFLQKKVLVVGIEGLKTLSIRNLLKQFSQCIKMTWVEIF